MCVCIRGIRISHDVTGWTPWHEVHGDQSISIWRPINSFSCHFLECRPSAKWLKCWGWKWWLLLKRGVDNVVQFTVPEVGARRSTGGCLSNLNMEGTWYFSETIQPIQPIIQAIIGTLVITPEAGSADAWLASLQMVCDTWKCQFLSVLHLHRSNQCES